MELAAIQSRIQELIVERLHLEGLAPGQIDAEAPLFESLGLDSVDALELVLGLEQAFGIKIAKGGIERSAFASVTSLAHYVQGCLARGPGELSSR